MTVRERHFYQFIYQAAALACSVIALASKRTLTHFGPSDILRPSPFANRDPDRAAHAYRFAHLAPPKLAFNPQVPR